MLLIIDFLLYRHNHVHKYIVAIFDKVLYRSHKKRRRIIDECYIVSMRFDFIEFLYNIVLKNCA